MTIPAEGVGVELIASPDSAAFLSQTVFTNPSGVFFMEIQFFPSIPAEGGTGYILPSSGVAGLTAHYNSSYYIYRSVDEGFVISAGDTLVVWPVAVPSFLGGGSK
jgi:hypothetical protein